MEIKNTQLQQAETYRSNLNETQNAAARRSAQASPENTATVQGDRVSVSPEAMMRTEAYKAANAAPEVRQEKVDALKEQVSSGTYKMDSRNIAKRLLESDTFLAGTLKE